MSEPHTCTCGDACKAAPDAPPAADLDELHGAVSALRDELTEVVDMAGVRLARYPMVFGTVWASAFAARAMLTAAGDELARLSDRGIAL